MKLHAEQLEQRPAVATQRPGIPEKARASVVNTPRMWESSTRQ